jgi:bilirubin oxidase
VWLPPATDIPSGYATVGSLYEAFAEEFADKTSATAAPGSAIFQYENDQRASTLWFHDHSLGMTRLNVYVGPAGFYLLRGGPADFPPACCPVRRRGRGTRRGRGPTRSRSRSRIGRSTGTARCSTPAVARSSDGFTGPYLGDPGSNSDISPIFNPEYFGNTMVVNGRTWPKLQVEPRRYRFRLPNGATRAS